MRETGQNIVRSILIFIIISFLASLAATWTMSKVHADSLTGGALSQRIGNFDVQLKTEPTEPIAGDKTNLMVRIGSINGEDVVDTPITIKVTLEGEELHRTNMIFVPYGHYTYSFNFPEPGMYGIDILVHDRGTQSSSVSSPSQEKGLLFMFPTNVQSKSLFGFEVQSVTVITILVAIFAGVLYSIKRRRKTPYQQNKMT